MYIYVPSAIYHTAHLTYAQYYIHRGLRIPILFMSSSVQERLEILRRKKVQCQEALNKQLALERKIQRTKTQAFEDEAIHIEEENEMDTLDWTASQWEAHEQKYKKQEGGYKDLTDLAYSTYQKATRKRAVDMEKYKNENHLSPFEVKLTKEDVENLSKSLQEASEIKKKRRRKEEDAGTYITEKNRQFNMKLEREYGS